MPKLTRREEREKKCKNGNGDNRQRGSEITPNSRKNVQRSEFEIMSHFEQAKAAEGYSK